MKKLLQYMLLTGIILAMGSCRKDNTTISKVRILQPGPNTGVDATVQSNFRFQNENFGSLSSLASWTWTDLVNGSPNYDTRILINFPELNQMTGNQIDSVKLTLYSFANFPYANGGQYGPNANYLSCITGNWDKNTVTWNNQPAYDSTNHIVIPTNNDYDSIVVDLTPLIPTEMKYGYGFEIMQQNEVPYSSSVFCSSNDSIASKRPKLTIYYK